MLRMLQESVASELAARMQAMQAASDNAKTLKTDLSREYNRARQAAVTQQIMEVIAPGTLAFVQAFYRPYLPWKCPRALHTATPSRCLTMKSYPLPQIVAGASAATE